MHEIAYGQEAASKFAARVILVEVLQSEPSGGEEGKGQGVA
jgi:hypothetical protein